MCEKLDKSTKRLAEAVDGNIELGTIATLKRKGKIF